MSLDQSACASDANLHRLSRRLFLITGAIGCGGFLLGISLPTPSSRAATPKAFTPDAFIEIGREGRVALTIPFAEMGQGTDTSISMLVAEELDIPLSLVDVHHAPGDERLYANPLYGTQITGGSSSIRAAWASMRHAGAAARTMLIAAAAQTWQVDAQSCRTEDGAVLHDISKRRLAYGALVDTAVTLRVPGQVTLKDPENFKLVGTPTKRIDAAGKVNGTARFGIDMTIPGMKIATVAACPVFGGKLAGIDDSKANSIKGVRQIVRIDNAVAVVADHMAAARKGLAALDIAWDEGPNAKVSMADLVSRIEAAAMHQGAVASKIGDLDKALHGAAVTIEANYHLPILAHAPMEPMNCTVHVRKEACDIWVGSQAPGRARVAAARITGLPEGNVQVHNMLLGGGFGRRLDIDYIEQAVRIARHVDGPVKIVWTREEDTQHSVYRGLNFSRVTAGLDAQGRPVAWGHRIVGPGVMARFLPAFYRDGVDLQAINAAAGPYDFANVLIDYVRHDAPDGMITGSWRGVGPTRNTFVVESFLDELAAVAKKDPIAYRRALLSKAPRARAVLDLAVEKSGWGTAMASRTGRGVSLLAAFGSYMAQVAEVAVDKDGRVQVTRVVAAIDCGLAVNPETIVAQIQGGIMYGISAALYSEITIKDGRVEQGNFDTYPVLRMNEAPAIEVYIVSSREGPGGIGEPGTAAIAPAMANAIFAATGKRLRKLPFDPAQLKSV